jgi:hypothetical protein
MQLFGHNQKRKLDDFLAESKEEERECAESEDDESSDGSDENYMYGVDPGEGVIRGCCKR